MNIGEDEWEDELFDAFQGKKSTFTFTKEKAHVRRKSKHQQTTKPPPNAVTQTVHHERAFERVFFAKENARERDALAPQYSRFLKKSNNSTFFSRKNVTKKDAERRAFSSLFSTRFERCITHTKHTHAHS